MSRQVSTVLREAIYHSGTEREVINLLEISHADLTEPFLFCSRYQGVTSGGRDFTYAPFHISLPDDSEDVPTSSFRIDNIDRRIIEAIRTIATKPTFKIWVVLDDDPDRIEAGPWIMRLANTRYDVLFIQLDVEGPSLLSEPHPAKTYNALDYPAIG